MTIALHQLRPQGFQSQIQKPSDSLCSVFFVNSISCVLKCFLAFLDCPSLRGPYVDQSVLNALIRGHVCPLVGPSLGPWIFRQTAMGLFCSGVSWKHLEMTFIRPWFFFSYFFKVSQSFCRPVCPVAPTSMYLNRIRRKRQRKDGPGTGGSRGGQNIKHLS